jgi:starch synthase
MSRIGRKTLGRTGFFGAALSLSRAVLEHMVDVERYNKYLHAFVWAEQEEIEDALDSLSSDLWHCLLADDKESMKRIERLLIGLLGHWDEGTRSLATMHLNAFYDDTDWQLLEPFATVIRTVGQEFVISERVDGRVKGEVWLQLHSLNFSKQSGNYIVSYHKPQIKHYTKQTQLKVDFENFPRCGFYDWRFVIFTEDNFQPLMASKPADRGSSYSNIAGELRTFPVQGRFIVHPSDVRDLQMHELFVDFQDAEFDYNTNQYIKRGSFKDVTASLKGRFSSGINCLYVMGALERDNGISHEKIDASPLSVVCRRSPCTIAGGESSFLELVREAKNLGVHILVDCLTRISSTNYHRRYKNEQLLVRNEEGLCVICYGSDGRSIRYEDTAMLNYRKAEVWDLLIDDILSFTRKYGVDGIHIDNAHAWPQVYELDVIEMYRKDADGEPHYSTQEIFDGLVVLRNENFGYWGCEASKRYASPLFLKLCKELWRVHPAFYIVADVWTGGDLEGREGVIARSGGIPRMYELPVMLAAICGKKLEKNGSYADCERKDVGILKKWYEGRRKRMPEGAIIVQSSTGHHLPYPALLFGRGAWAAADALLLMPDVPMTFSGEQSGHAYRPNITNIYTQQAPTTRAVPKPISATNISAIGEADLMAKPVVPRVESSTSLSAVSSQREIKTSTERLVKEVGPEYGFDLTQIGLHYKHRRMIRCEKEVIRKGDLIPLVVKHAHGWHKQVLAFARYTPDETAIIVINFNDHPVKGYLELQKLEGRFSALESNIFSFGKWSDPDSDDYYLKEELLSEAHEVELSPFRTELFGIYPSDVDAKVALQNAVDRFMKKLSNNQPTDSTFWSKRLLNLLSSDKIDLLGVGNHLGLVNQYALQPYAVSPHDFIMSISEINPILAGKLLAYCAKIKGARGPFNPTKSAAEQILETNKLGPIVFTAPELGRWSTVGGLGVMVDELSIGLANLGEEVWLISPYYERNKKGATGYLEGDPANINWIVDLNIPIGDTTYQIKAFRGWENGVHYVFLQNAYLFPSTYADGTASFVMSQLVAWARGTMEVLCYLQVIPAVLLTNDWFTGLVAAYAKNGSFGNTFNGTCFFHIAHNLDATYEGRQYPGPRDGTFDHLHHLPRHLLVDPYWHRIVANPSRCALLCSDQWATVSGSYRNELLSTSPLKELLKQKQRPFAFPNGIPVESRKARLKRHGTHLEAKAEIQRRYFSFGDLDDSVPILSFVGRITEQKGVHLILDAAESLIPHYNLKIQFLVGGPGNPKDPYAVACMTRMRSLRSRYPNSFYANPDEFFMEGPLVNLGSDFGLMPSKFEPGGIVQHEFFVAGTPVIAFETGGLKDTVHEFDPASGKGGGFTFKGYHIGDMLYATDRALNVYRDKAQYEQLRKNAEAAVIDVKEVSRAWCQEIYRLRNKIFAEPEERLRVAELLNETAITAEDFVPVPPSNKQEVRIHRTPSGMFLSQLPQENRPPQSSSDSKRRVLMRYMTRGNKVKSVQVTGSFDKWQIRYPMMYDHSNSQWYLTLQLPKGKHLYKFVVEGNVWVCSMDHPQEADSGGNFNNVIQID